MSAPGIDRDAFVARYGRAFESSPWVAERAFDAEPFAGIDDLHRAMVAVVLRAGAAEQLALLRAHPELAGREAQAGTMTESSASEQASAGLDRLSRDEAQRIAELNAGYAARHGFPFIIAVRNYTKAQIFDAFARRSTSDPAREVETALSEVFAIARIRLERLHDGRAWHDT